MAQERLYGVKFQTNPFTKIKYFANGNVFTDIRKDVSQQISSLRPLQSTRHLDKVIGHSGRCRSIIADNVNNFSKNFQSKRSLKYENISKY